MAILAGLAVLAVSSGCSKNSGAGSKNSAALPDELAAVISRCTANEALVLLGCPEYRAWSESKIAQALGSEKELFPLLSAPQPLARSLVAKVIDERACPDPARCTYAKDSELAEQLLFAAEAERDPRVAAALARPLARIDFVATNLAERVERLVDHAPEQLSHVLLALWLDRNPELFATTARFARSPKLSLSRGALEGLRYALGGPHHTAACALAVDSFGENSEYDFLATTIVSGFREKNCSHVWDSFLTKVEQRGQKGIAFGSSWLAEVWAIPELPGATPALEQRVERVALSIVESKANNPSIRLWAAGYVLPTHADPQGFLKHLSEDTEHEVRRQAGVWMGNSAGAFRSNGGRRKTGYRRIWRDPEDPHEHAPRAQSPKGPDVADMARAAQATRAQTPEPGADEREKPEVPEEPASAEESAAQRKATRLVTRILVPVLVVAIALIGGLITQVRKRRARGAPASSTLPEPMVRPSVAPSAPPAARPSPTVSTPSPGRCVAHGLAVGPDGRCVLCRTASQAPPKQQKPVMNWKRVALIGGLGLIAAGAYVVWRLPGSSPRSKPESYPEETTEQLVAEMEREQARHLEKQRRRSKVRTPAERAAHLDEYFGDETQGVMRMPSETGIRRRMSEFDIVVQGATRTRICDMLEAHGMHCTDRTYQTDGPHSLLVDGYHFGIPENTSDDELVRMLWRQARQKLIVEWVERGRSRR